MKNKFLLSCHGRFHYFEIAKILYKNDQLSQIVSGYPWFKLKNENLPKNKVTTVAFGIFTILAALSGKISPVIFKKLIQILSNIRSFYIDKRSSNFLENSDIFLALSGGGLETGKLFKKRDKIYICERSSAHISEQNEILKEEYKKYNISFNIDPHAIDRELQEYKEATFILIPSEFCKNSFSKQKIYNTEVIPYAANLDKFYPLPKSKNKKTFDILYIGALSLQKGLPYLLDAFNNFNHPNKRLHIIGGTTADIVLFKNKLNFKNIKVYGHIPNNQLVKFINQSDIFAIASIQDGYSVVVSQAAACGLPSIVTSNNGAADTVSKHNYGFVVPPFSSSAITEKLYEIADKKDLLNQLSINAIKASSINTWGNFVKSLNERIEKYKNNITI